MRWGSPACTKEELVEYLPENEHQFIARILSIMKGRRNDLRLTQDACARMLGRAHHWWSVRERGTHPMDLSDATLVAAVLQVPQMGKQLKVAALPPRPAPAPARTPGLLPPSERIRSTPRTRWAPESERPKKPEPPVTPSRPTPAVMPKKAEPAPVVVSGVARVPQMVNQPPVAKVTMPSTFMWKDDLKVRPGSNEATMGILAVDGDLEGTLELPIQDARRLKEQLALKLPHRNTEASGYVTSMLDRINRALSVSIAVNRRAKVMRLIQPEVMAVMTDVWSELRDVKAGAAAVEEELTQELDRLAQNGVTAKTTSPVKVHPDEKGAEVVTRQTAESDRCVRLTKELESAKSEKRTLDGKLERIRKEMESQDALVERLKKQIKDAEGNPTADQAARKEAEAQLDGAFAILDEIWELGEMLKGSASPDNKMTGSAIQSKMKEMGYDSE